MLSSPPKRGEALAAAAVDTTGNQRVAIPEVVSTLQVKPRHTPGGGQQQGTVVGNSRGVSPHVSGVEGEVAGEQVQVVVEQEKLGGLERGLKSSASLVEIVRDTLNSRAAVTVG